MKRSILLISLVAIAVGSCAPVRPTAYVPEDQTGYGYRDMPLGDSTYRVVFAGNPETSLEQVDRYALYRAAEVTLEHGGDYFAIVDEKQGTNTITTNGGSTTNDAKVGNTIQPIGSVFPNTTTAEASTSSNYYSSTQTQHSSIKTFRIFKEKPVGTGLTAYDARALSGTMADQLAQDTHQADLAAQSASSVSVWQYILYAVLAIVAVGLISTVSHT